MISFLLLYIIDLHSALAVAGSCLQIQLHRGVQDVHAQEQRMDNMVCRQSVWVLCDKDDMLHGTHIEPVAG